MYKKINTLLLVGLFYQTFGFLQRLDNGQSNFTAGAREIDARGECKISFNKTGFCVQARNCNLDYSKFNKTTINKFKCGPRNQNSKNPYVCCELSKILDSERTEPPPSISKSPPSITEPPFVTQDEPPEACGTQLSMRIVGGSRTSPGEFPWLAKLIRVNKQGNSMYVCTGALISPRVVLTAAHCISSPNRNQLGPLAQVYLAEHETECVFGETDCLQDRKVVNISELIVHPQYQPRSKTFYHDIGLVVLKERVEFTRTIMPICLLRERVEPVNYFVAGWGRTESGFFSNVKLKTSLAPFAWQQCVAKYATINVTIWEKQLCAGGMKGQDSCRGDSGGPLMILQDDGRWYAAGVVSFGTQCGMEGWPGIYTNIPSYIDWIKSEMRKKRS